VLDQPQSESVHFELDFNGMIISFCDKEDQCAPDASFWMCWDDWPRLEAFVEMNGGSKIDNKKAFGFLVASRIVQLRL
jgi:hypothetical protein